MWKHAIDKLKCLAQWPIEHRGCIHTILTQWPIEHRGCIHKILTQWPIEHRGCIHKILTQWPIEHRGCIHKILTQWPIEHRGCIHKILTQWPIEHREPHMMTGDLLQIKFHICLKSLFVFSRFLVFLHSQCPSKWCRLRCSSDEYSWVKLKLQPSCLCS